MTLSPRDLRVLFRDEHFLVVDKPVGIATTAPDGGPSLFALARALDMRAPRLHPLSRLDTQVSGIVAFARTVEANRMALSARREGKLSRRYLGLATARPVPPAGEWRFAIGIDERDPKKRRALAPEATGLAVKHALTRHGH